jgi:hypothetical protein
MTPARGACSFTVVVALLTMLLGLLLIEPLAEIRVAISGVAAVHVAKGALVAVGAVAVAVHGQQVAARLAGGGVGGEGQELRVLAVTADVAGRRRKP